MTSKTKTCKDCGATLPIAEFNRTPNKTPGNSGFGTGLRARCKACHSHHYRQWRLKNKEKPFNPPAEKYCSTCQMIKPWTEFTRDRNAIDGLNFRCRACLRLRYPHAGKRTPEQSREHNLRQMHHIGLSDYEAMVKGQNGICPICAKEITAATGKGLAPVDHDHRTGKIRGVLCHRCNLWLGVFERMEPGVLERIKAYLRL